MESNADLQSMVRKYTLMNAAKYNGVAQVGSVLSSIMGENKDLRPKARDIKPLVERDVQVVNAMGIDAVLKELETLGVDLDGLHPKKEEKGLPVLPGLEHGKTPTFRLAPYPSGPLHIGNARMVVLNDEYCKLTNGKLVLCFDDTIGATKKKIKDDDSGAKFVVPEAYDLIRDGLKWLGVKWHEEVFKSDRLPIYYDHCKQFIENGHAYVCTCDAGAFKALKDKKLACPHRDLPPSEQLAGWQKMLDGSYDEGEAVVRMKTGITLKDPALREPVIMRISHAEHPRVGSKYHLWPMLEFSWGIDDQLLGISHIIRGKDLFKEDYIEEFIWNILGWKKLNILHYGIISFSGAKLSKTHAREQISHGKFLGWDDPRTWSLQSLQKRGFKPEALRAVLLGMGLSMVDIDFPYNILYAENQKLIDPTSDRYFFVPDPCTLRVHDIPEENYLAHPFLNPLDETRGKRAIPVKVAGGQKDLLIARNDFTKLRGADTNTIVRMKDLFNVLVAPAREGTSGTALDVTYHSKELEAARDAKASVIHWVDSDATNNMPVKVLNPDGEYISGFGELNLKDVQPGSILQFERFGFVKVQENSKKALIAWLTH
nr:glutamate--tRNA ligase [Candidatus Sigynarchaeota archaeon]